VKVLLTGASCFVGANLIEVLKDAGNKVVATSRSRVEQPGIFCVRSPKLGPAADLVNNTFAEGNLLAGIRKPRETSIVK
jgi:nucleoside-diphosphate-sugar epimerase